MNRDECKQQLDWLVGGIPIILVMIMLSNFLLLSSSLDRITQQPKKMTYFYHQDLQMCGNDNYAVFFNVVVINKGNVNCAVSMGSLASTIFYT